MHIHACAHANHVYCGGVTATIILTKSQNIYVGTKFEIVQRFIRSIFGLLGAATLQLYTYISKCLCRPTFTPSVARFLLLRSKSHNNCAQVHKSMTFSTHHLYAFQLLFKCGTTLSLFSDDLEV